MRSRNTKKQTTYSLAISLKIHLSVKKQVMVKTKDNKKAGKQLLLSKVETFLKVSGSYPRHTVLLYTLRINSLIPIRSLTRG